MKVLVTGAAGFVGRFLCAELARRQMNFVAVVRSESGYADEQIVPDISPHTDWTEALRGVDAVVHLAARVHRMKEGQDKTLEEYCRVNTQATLNLARQCVDFGVSRFVYVSSIKVNGEGRASPYTAFDVPKPSGAYAVSKWEAEMGLADVSSSTGLAVVVLRPPLIYGPGVGANFARLMTLVAKGWPLPFGSIRNRRSILYVGNMCSAIIRSIEHQGAPGRVFLLHDGEPVSTAHLITLIADACGMRARLLPVPLWMLASAARILGQRDAVARLTESLCVDDSSIRDRLDWIPPYTTEEGVLATVKSRPFSD